jgi:hypothetical protein
MRKEFISIVEIDSELEIDLDSQHLRSDDASFCRPFRARRFWALIQGRRATRAPLATFCRACGAEGSNTSAAPGN